MNNADLIIKRFSKYAIWIVIVLGILMRLAIYLQNRNLIIDEANIVRNLYERDFIALLKPLRYEQYAPPVFLWMEELLSMFFGFGEKALKLYPLLCGIGALFVFRNIMKRFVGDEAIWLPLALLAFSPYFIEFSATIKQYMPDALIVLVLIQFALQYDMFKMPGKKFWLFWSITGVIAICSSMPSVFALAGVGFYYAWQCVRQKKWSHIGLLLLIAVVWLAAFGIYYWYILRPQITSDYLQNYHADYFLYATPANAEEWKHNWMRLEEILSNTGGYTFVNFILTSIFIITGIVTLLKKRFDVLILVFVPVLLTLFAAALNQFSLIMRVSLFLLPLLLILFCYGLGQFWKIKLVPVKMILMLLGFLMISSFNDFQVLKGKDKHAFHEITEGLDYLNAKKIEGSHLYIHDASVPTFIYYTEMHPQRDRYNSLLGAHLLKWDSDYTSVTKNVRDTVYFLYTGGFPDGERQRRTEQIEQNMVQVDYFQKYVCFVYGYAPKPDTGINR